MRTTLLLILLGCFAFTTQAQTQKIGYADTEYILSQMPEMKQLENDLKTHATQLENQLKAKSQELQTKYGAYQNMPATTPDAIKKDKESELTQLQENIQKFQQDAQASIQKKQTDLMEPIYAKVHKATEDVAKENAYSFIINSQLGAGADVLLYNDENYDISKLVLKKLGVTPSATPAVGTATPVKKN
jgi:outer membrane protein